MMALASLGDASEQLKGCAPAQRCLAVGQALLGAGDAQGQVLDGPRVVVAALEMDGELGSDLGQALQAPLAEA